MAMVLEDLLVGALYLPFLVMPFALLFWYALVAAGQPEAVKIKDERAPGSTG